MLTITIHNVCFKLTMPKFIIKQARKETGYLAMPQNLCTVSKARQSLNSLRDAAHLLTTLCRMAKCDWTKSLSELDWECFKVFTDSVSQLRFVNMSEWRPVWMMRSQTSSQIALIDNSVCNQHECINALVMLSTQCLFYIFLIFAWLFPFFRSLLSFLSFSHFPPYFSKTFWELGSMP